MEIYNGSHKTGMTQRKNVDLANNIAKFQKKCFGKICQLGMKLDTVEASFSHRLHDLRTTGILSKD